MGRTASPESPAERYRQRAADLRAMADKAQDRGVRDELEVMARQYDQLAERARRRTVDG